MSEQQQKDLIQAADGDLELVRSLVTQGVDVNFVDDFGETALTNASRCGRIKIVEFLLNSGADINLQFIDKTGWTALMCAGFFGHKELVTYLVVQGANPQLQNKKGETVLDMAPCMNATQEEVRAAVQRGIKDLSVRKGTAFSDGASSAAAAAATATDAVAASSGDADEGKKPVYEQISVHAGQTEALMQFGELYQNTCADFDQQPKEAVSRIVNLMVNKTAPAENLMLSGREGRAAEDRITDNQIFPLFEVLGHGFPNNPFHTIDLSYNNIRNSGAKAIAVYLSQTITLTHLNLEGNAIGQLGCEKIAQSLSDQQTLKGLSFNNNPIGDKGMCVLAEALMSNKCLAELDLGGSDIGTLALIKLAGVLCCNTTALTTLNVDKPLLHGMQEDTTIALAKALGSNSSLTSLSLAKHSITDSGASWIGEYLERNQNITHLNLSCNKLSATGAASLAQALGNRRLGCRVVLDCNQLKGREHDEIFEALEGATQGTVAFESEQASHALVCTLRRGR